MTQGHLSPYTPGRSSPFGTHAADRAGSTFWGDADSPNIDEPECAQLWVI